LGLVVFLGALVWAILIAWLRRRRYCAVGVMTEAELEAVKTAIAEEECRTTGELMVVLLERSDPHRGAHWLAAVFFVFAGSLFLAPWLPWHTPALLVACQVGLAGLGYGLTRALPDLQYRFLSPKTATSVAEEQALQEFHQLELYGAPHRAGLLIFVSLLEHRVVVLADEGIHGKVDPDIWIDVHQSILERIRADRLGEGLVDGVRRVGAILAEHFPSEGGANHLPNVVVVRPE
ncbi:MAG TPA: hypothetical protein PLJ12_14760, partial [Planctomycetota bacterium]|nr:hypothetical protein [Planctomycetota bacterium]